ncbi:MAG: flagellar hook-basal body complex protein [Roseburia sp.]|nr:flagellar hook-basal body complex protein [Roseburia sp.]
MLRSLYSGVAGLKTHQVKMDVIGNNIANVNTTAYKSSSITFSELMSQTTQKASGPNAANGVGGTNARQIGLGVKTGAINVNISSQGASQSTGNPFDVMITGSNFFVVNNGTDNFFTRDGSFYVDGAGNLAMTSTGYNVMGWGVDPETGSIKKDTVAALRIMSAANMTYPPEATSQAYVAGILDKHDTNVTSASGKSINLNFYDALGYSYTAKFVFKQSDDINNYSIELDKILDSTGQEIDISGVEFGNKGVSQERERKVSFNTAAYTWDGKVLMSADKTTVYADVSQMFDGTQLKTGEYTYDGETLTVEESLNNIAKAYGYEGATEEFLSLFTLNDAGDPLSIEQMLANLASGNPGDAGALPVFTSATDDPSFTVAGRKFDGAYIDFNGDNGKFAGLNGSSTQNTLIMRFVSPADDPGKYGNFSDITIDFSQCSMYDNKGTSTIGATNGDLEGLGTGRRLGDLIGVSIQSNGMIYASYDNGMTKLLGQIATAEFPNASGLEKTGDNLYSATLNSGSFDGIGEDVTANGGYMSTGQLEISNVDLSAEFTEMITTQRGFQANSRIITVSDTLLEELTNLKR